MANPFISAQVIDLFSHMLKALPDLSYRYVRQELVRHVARFKKQTIRDRMSGPPGIDAPKLSKGQHLSVYVKGDRLQNLVAYSRIGRILKVHEEGATIHARGGGYLYIHNKEGKIVAKVKSVTIPARLGWLNKWNEMAPDARRRIQSALNRAAKVAGEQRVQKIIKIAG